MMWNEIIQRMATEPMSESDLEAIAQIHQLSLRALCDAFAREVGEGYLRGTYTWELCDAAMNNLFSSAYANADFGLSDFATRVFETFDEGEYIHLDSKSELDGEPRTTSMLAKILRPMNEN